MVSRGKPGVGLDSEGRRAAWGEVGGVVCKLGSRRDGIACADRQSNGHILIACIGDCYGLRSGGGLIALRLTAKVQRLRGSGNAVTGCGGYGHFQLIAHIPRRILDDDVNILCVRRKTCKGDGLLGRIAGSPRPGGVDGRFGVAAVHDFVIIPSGLIAGKRDRRGALTRAVYRPWGQLRRGGIIRYGKGNIHEVAGEVGLPIPSVPLVEHLEGIAARLKAGGYGDVYRAGPAAEDLLDAPVVEQLAAIAVAEQSGDLLGSVIHRAGIGDLHVPVRIALFFCCDAVRSSSSGKTISTAVQQRQLPLMAVIVGNRLQLIVAVHPGSGDLAVDRGGDKEDSVRIQVERGASQIEVLYGHGIHGTVGIDRARGDSVARNRGTEPPRVCAIAIICNTRGGVCKSVSSIVRFLRRQEKEPVPAQNICRSGKLDVISAVGARNGIYFVAFRRRQDRALLLREQTLEEKGIIAPALRVAALPCVAISEIHAVVGAVFSTQQPIGQQEEPVAPCVGLVVQHPPFDGAVAPVTEIDIVIAICGAVIAGDPARAKLYGFACVCPCCKGGCRRKPRKQAKAEQQA